MKGKNDELTNEMKSAKKEYYRNYRRQNPDKYKDAQKRFWQRKAEQKLNSNK